MRAGRLDTGLVGRRLEALIPAGPPPDILPAAAVLALAALEPSGNVVDPFDVPGGWRVGEPAWTAWRMTVDGTEPVEVRARGRAADALVVVGDAEPVAAATSVRRGGRVPVTVDGATRGYAAALDGDTLWLGRTAAPGRSASRPRWTPPPRRRPGRAGRSCRRCPAR